MERTFARTCSLVLCLFVIVSSSQRFDLPAASSGSRGLRLDGDGRVYISSGSELFRLSSNLESVERRNLTSEAVNITLSSDGRWLVVCLSDRSCEVYNATNLSADDQPVFQIAGAIVSSENVALFAAEESFYVGSISITGTDVQEKIVLGQYGFAGSQVGVTQSREYMISRNEFERNMYGGFVRGDYAYYFVVDNDPTGIRSFRVMRVCHNGNFRALSELSLTCVRDPSSNTRISGVSLVDNFGGISGPTVVLSRNRPSSSQNYVCLFSLDTIDNMIVREYNDCVAADMDSLQQIDIAWINQAVFCRAQAFNGICDYGNTLSALDDVENLLYTGDFRIDHGAVANNFITASAAALFDSFSLVFLAYIDTNGDSYIIGYDAGNTPGTLTEQTAGFDRRFIADGPVRQLQLNVEAGLLFAVTDTSVLQFPTTACSSHSTCTSCLSGNPLCGWCVVENKCSEISECQNSDNDTRWIRAARNIEQCPTITVTPQQYVLDNPMTITLSLSQRLPTLLDGEAYRCHFAGGGPTFMVDAVGANTSYSCNITGRLPSLQGLSTVYDVSFISSLAGIPFSTSVGALTVYQCGQTSSCSACLQTNNACGWCVYNKLCRGTSDECINGTDNYLQPNLGMSETFMDVCPLLAPPSPGQNYTQPVIESGTIELVTRNLPPAISGFTYWCEVNNVQLDATYNNETSLTCTVDANELMLPSEVGQRPVDVNIRWVGQGISHPIDASTPVSVNLFNCAELADGCSSCLGSGFDCTWCSRTDVTTSTCTYTGTCEASPIASGANCPRPSISSFNPTSGPVEGGTTITISGRELGVSFDDFSANSITVGGVPCTPTDRQSYVPGRQINCITTAGGTMGSKVIMVTLPSGTFTTMDLTFRVATPQISGVTPSLGPVAGGTSVTVFGTDLDIGNREDTRITLVGGGMCEVNRSSIQADSINCTTPMFTGSPGTNGPITVAIDNAMITDGSVQFMYAPNPEFYSVSPSNTILAGGIELIFNGSNLNSVQSPVLVVIQDANFEVNRSVCTVLNSTTIRCITPSLTRRQSGSGNGLTYTIMVDNAPGPDPNSVGLQISVSPNPGNFELIDSEYNTGSTNLIRITGTNIDSVRDEDYSVTVGGEVCTITAITPTEINCAPPSEPPGSTNQAEVVVSVGAYLSETLDQPLAYIAAATLPLQIIIPAVVGSVVVVMILSLFIICCVVCYHRKKSRKNEQRWTNLLSQMELMELEMADECKRAFTELQTDLADLVQISDANLPYRDFRSFAMRFLFPQAGKDHPVLLPLQLPEKSEPDDVVENLKSFQSLIMDKKFLLVFIHTLEAQGPNFTLQDKCTVASLLMVAFQNDLDYATDVLQTLLSELMRKSLNNKTHPKLLLRRTESVAEKMLANWLAFLLYPYLLEHVGQPLFTLYRAIKSQLEKGPVDVISGEARHSLSEEKLLRHSIEVKSIEGIVEPESGEDIPIKMLDCDSITQAKEKVLDALYKNCPASKRPQLTEVDLILQCGTAQLTLRDQDQTNRREGDWTKVNTLGHYNVDEMSQKHRNNPKLPIPRFKLEKRPERPVSGASFDALGTIIANIGTESRANLMMSGELSHVFHLVKPEADEGDESVEKRGKIMSEVFLTRLLSTKRILQPYVDAVFEAIFTIPQGRQLPKAVKSLFDFLDLQASDLGIQDHEILHTWKTNSVPLRFWVNIIKNPDFVFDLHKSVTVDSCLTVIAQAYIDACSTAEMKYTKETPSARLLYVNEVKKYKQDVQTYYNSVQSQPKLSQYEMGEYLRETAQVCANSVLQVEPDLDTKDLGPSSMTRQLYFVTESALLELFKFASEYSADIVDGLNEEGLSIMATNFQQLKKSIPV